MENWKGVVIAESLGNPTIINRYPVERALISKPFEWVPYKGAKPFSGRWHLYRVCCAEKDLECSSSIFSRAGSRISGAATRWW